MGNHMQPFRGAEPPSAERRAHERAPVDILCRLDVPGLAAFHQAYIVDLSAGGLRLRLPKIKGELLEQPFVVHWTMAGMRLKRQVELVRYFSNNEIAVRFVHVGNVLADEISRYVGITLKAKSIVNKLPEPLASGQPSVAPESRQRPQRLAMQKDHMSAAEAAVEARNLHVSSVQRWIGRRVATQLAVQ